MFNRFQRLLHHCVVVMGIVVVATGVAIIVTGKWQPHASHLFLRSWSNFLTHVGTTEAGFLSPIIVSILSVIGTLVCIRFLQGKEAMLKHWWENAAITALITLVVLLVVYGPQLGWQFAQTIYEDHQSLVERNRELLGQGQGNPYAIPLNNQYAATINTLSAFKSLTGNGHKCIIRISYPDKSSQQSATVLRSLASVVDCNMDEIRLDEPRGMLIEKDFKSIPGTILIRSRRKDVSGFATALGNAFNVKISEDLPPKEAMDLVWLQIGEGDILRRQ
jgi:hypothetical protein